MTRLRLHTRRAALERATGRGFAIGFAAGICLMLAAAMVVILEEVEDAPSAAAELSAAPAPARCARGATPCAMATPPRHTRCTSAAAFTQPCTPRGPVARSWPPRLPPPQANG